MTRQIYVCADHVKETFTDSEHYESFPQIAVLLNMACHIEPQLLGKKDLAIRGNAVISFKTQLLDSLEKKISALAPDKAAHVQVAWGEGTIALNRRNAQHSFILRLFDMLDMANAEIERDGSIYFYSLAALDNTNTYIAKTFKGEKNGIGMAAAFTKFTASYEQYNAMQQEEFEERVQQLISGGFLRTEEIEGSTLLYPTIKTDTIKLI